MIILSVGMPRAGSGWYYNLTNDIMLANGAQNARQIRQRYHLQRILTEVNCNIGALTTRRLLAVLAPSLMGNTFVIKAHAGPTPLALQLIRTGRMHTAYIYRDPRDAMLSAYENGQRSRGKGRENAFSALVDFETALAFMLDYLKIWEAWTKIDQILHTRYEDFLINYQEEARRLTKFLPIDPTKNKEKNSSIIQQYQPQSAQKEQKGLHFSKGRIGRFREKWSEEQQKQMTEAFGPYLKKMGYPL